MRPPFAPTNAFVAKRKLAPVGVLDRRHCDGAVRGGRAGESDRPDIGGRNVIDHRLADAAGCPVECLVLGIGAIVVFIDALVREERAWRSLDGSVALS